MGLVPLGETHDIKFGGFACLFLRILEKHGPTELYV